MKSSLEAKVFLALLFMGAMSLMAQHDGRNDGKAPIPIGLLVNSGHEQEAVPAAKLAIKEVNARGGVGGRPLQLIVRSVEGSWGAGSNEVVDLVFNEKVWAILGSVKGRNMHMAEQVIAKTQVVFLSSWASDPTLSGAYVPWYFSVVPTDDQQAELIVEDIIKQNNILKLAVFYTSGYDGKKAVESLIRAAQTKSSLEVVPFEYKGQGSEIPIMAKEAEDLGLQALVLLGEELPFSIILEALKDQDFSVPLYAGLSCFASEEFQLESGKYGNKVFAFDAGEGLSSVKSSFHKDFYNQYHMKATVLGAYTYDGIMVIAEALNKSGNDRALLKQGMSKVHFQGLTGLVDFDANGRLKNRGKLVLLKD